jgi:pimeloyl-ACP methyl ester carboxylesterase
MVNANELFYEEEGIGNSETIIFLHPKMMASWVWKNQRGCFKDYDCIYLDLPNHGFSPSDETFTIKRVSELIKDFILLKTKPEFKSSKVNLVGVGTGGLIAFELLCKYPELLDKIVVSGVSTPLPELVETRSEASVNVFKDTEYFYDKKSIGFIVKSHMAIYNFNQRFFNDMKFSLEHVSPEDVEDISFAAMNYRIPEIKDTGKGEDLLLAYGSKDERVVAYSSYDFHKAFPLATCLNSSNIQIIIIINNFNKTKLIKQSFNKILL